MLVYKLKHDRACGCMDRARGSGPEGTVCIEWRTVSEFVSMTVPDKFVPDLHILLLNQP